MEFNMILAGVGGQGILSIAQAISIAAMRRGWNVKQSEVHGMSQRGGAVQAHLRIADHELFSDLIPLGGADMVLAAEPLEMLRYVQFLAEHGNLVSNTAPFVNIPNYPPIEQVLDRIARYPRHVLVDADRLARAAGSGRASNMVMLGAASFFMDVDADAFDAPITEIFSRKGQQIVDVNLRAARFGRNAAAAYCDGLRRGGTAATVRHWIETLPPEQLSESVDFSAPAVALTASGEPLSAAELHAVEQTLSQVEADGRARLYEHEVYNLLELIGAIVPPRYLFLRRGNHLADDALARFPGDRVVLKIVSPDIVHKTEARAIAFAPKDIDAVNREAELLINAHAEGNARIDGVLVVEFVPQAGRGFGSELFVGIRASREFGPVIAAGLGGVDTEYLASKIKGGLAVAKALALETDAEQFFELFKRTTAYEIIAGRVRGHQRIVSDGELMRCFRAFLGVARNFCVDRGEHGPDLYELEVNPFAFVRQRLVPLDGRGKLATATRRPAPRPLSKTRCLLEPRSIAVLGVSAKRSNFGRIILDNIKACGFPQKHLYVIKEGHGEIDGIMCVPAPSALPERVDLLVIATAGDDMPALMDEIVRSRKVVSVIIIPGGLGETTGSGDVMSRLRAAIAETRSSVDGGPIVLGPNCLGVRSRPGRYDTFFIEDSKLDPRRQVPPRRCAMISQSGAFIITRMSNTQFLDPTLAVSIGNQIDLTVADLMGEVASRSDVDCIGVYVEGFNDLDGLEFVRAVSDATSAGKVVVFYKAGRTAPGRSATAGHTASVAGDYDVCDAAVANAGAIVTDTFKEFEQLMELSTALHGKSVSGRRIGAISNAGYETVGMADAIVGARYQVELARPAEKTLARIAETLEKYKLRALINVRNPLDITPMASDAVYEECLRAMLDDDGVDAMVVSCVPLTPQMLTAPEEVDRVESLAHRLPMIFQETTKPVIAVIDSGPPFDVLAAAIRSAGVPTFRSCDQAIRSLGRYLCHRVPDTRARNGRAAAKRRPSERAAESSPVAAP